MFCPKCHKLMFPGQGGKMRCKKCGFEADKGAVPSESIEIKQQDVDELGRPKEVVVMEDAQVLSRCKETCPKCGHNEATWFLNQTRKSDEPPTRFYRCTKCKYGWRGY